MSKAEWTRHMTDLGLVTKVAPTPEGLAASKLALEHMRSGCPICKARKVTYRASRNRRERDEICRDLGLVKTPYGWE